MAIVTYGPNWNGRVDSRLLSIINQAAASWPGTKVELISGRDSRAYTPNHPAGRAVDVQLYDQNGQPLYNEPVGRGGAGAKQTAASFGAYQAFANLARDVQQQQYPELDNAFAWGGYFGLDGHGKNASDLMHFDVGGTRGTLGTWAGGLNAAGRQLLPDAAAWNVLAGIPDAQMAYAPDDKAGDLLANVSTPTTPRSVLSKGMADSQAKKDVSSAQDLLIANGANIHDDGKFGAATQAAVRSFQRSQGLPVDGILGPRTLDALRSRISFPQTPVQANVPPVSAQQFGFGPGIGPTPSFPSPNALNPPGDIPGMLSSIPLPRLRPDMPDLSAPRATGGSMRAPSLYDGSPLSALAAPTVPAASRRPSDLTPYSPPTYNLPDPLADRGYASSRAMDRTMAQAFSPSLPSSAAPSPNSFGPSLMGLGSGPGTQQAPSTQKTNWLGIPTPDRSMGNSFVGGGGMSVPTITGAPRIPDFSIADPPSPPPTISSNQFDQRFGAPYSPDFAEANPPADTPSQSGMTTGANFTPYDYARQGMTTGANFTPPSAAESYSNAMWQEPNPATSIAGSDYTDMLPGGPGISRQSFNSRFDPGGATNSALAAAIASQPQLHDLSPQAPPGTFSPGGQNYPAAYTPASYAPQINLSGISAPRSSYTPAPLTGNAAVDYPSTYSPQTSLPPASPGGQNYPNEYTPVSYTAPGAPAQPSYNPLSSAYLPSAPGGMPSLAAPSISQSDFNGRFDPGAAPAVAPVVGVPFSAPVAGADLSAPSAAPVGAPMPIGPGAGMPPRPVSPPMVRQTPQQPPAQQHQFATVLQHLFSGQPLFGGSFNGFGLFGGTPLASAISRGMVPAGGSTSPITGGYVPSGWSAPNFDSRSGGSTSAYTYNASTGQGSYVTPSGQVYPYSTAHP